MPELTTPKQSTPANEQTKPKLRYEAPALVHLADTRSGEGGGICQDGGTNEQQCLDGPNHASV
jgi:hypothetical protein